MRGSRVLALGLGIVGAAIIIRPGLVEFNIGIAYVIGVIAVLKYVRYRDLGQSELDG